jgi:protein phosphatase 4 regulatory subunit 3
MAQIQPPQGNERKRVKVYELKNNDWFDRGTGFCSGQVINVSCSPVRTRPVQEWWR